MRSVTVRCVPVLLGEGSLYCGGVSMLLALAAIRAAVWHSQSCLDTNQHHNYSTLKKQALLYVLLAEAGGRGWVS